MIQSIICGSAWKFGAECDTGQIIPGKYIPLTDPVELASHVFEGIRPEFRKQIKQGDIIVAERNFGCGSSREHAPKAIRYAGISAVVADSFARIFYRNALNLGLLPIAIPGISAQVTEGDQLEIKPLEGTVRNVTTKREFHFTPYEPFIMEMIKHGGIIEYTKFQLGIKQSA